MDRIPDRERVAKTEIGQTDITPALARTLVAVFLAVVLVPLVADLLTGRAAKTGVTGASLVEVGRIARQDGFLAGSRALLRQMNQFETGLERNSWLGDTLLPLTQRSLVWFGMGNEKVYLGRDGWLYYAPDLDYTIGKGFLDPEVLLHRARGGREWETAPQPDPLPALVAFRDDLARRGIALLLVPAPLKPEIVPGPLAGRDVPVPIENPSFASFVDRLERAGIVFFDPAPALAQASEAKAKEPQYLRTDTHWSPAAAARIAEEIAARVEAMATLSPRQTGAYVRRAQAIANSGDLAALLTLPPGHPLKQPERTTIERVELADGRPWRPDPRAEVLLLGDSFSNVFSESDLGWGTGAGLAEQLSFALQRPVDRIALNSGGALATRQRLAQDLANGIDRLAGKKVVVYELAARELAFGDWRVLPLPR